MAPSVTEIRVSKQGFIEKVTPIKESRQSKQLIVTLDPASALLSGQIYLSNGEFAKAFIMRFGSVDNAGQFYTKEFNTDDGRFLVSDLPAGSYRLQIQSNGPAREYVFLPNVEIRSSNVSGTKVKPCFGVADLTGQS